MLNIDIGCSFVSQLCWECTAVATILIVDDCPDQLRLIAQVIQSRTNHTCVFAASAAAALERLETLPLDLLLTDLMLPDGNGLQLIEDVRSTYPSIPVMLMTSEGSEEAAISAVKAGAASYIPKRQLTKWLIDEIEAVLGRARVATCRTKLSRMRSAITEQYSLTNDRTLIAPLINSLQQQFADFALCNEDRQLRVGIALEEALANAIIHGNLEVTSELRGVDDEAYAQLIAERESQAPYNQRRVKVTASFDRSRALIIIRDQGRGFNVQAVPDPQLPENMSRAHGRGLLLIRTFFDEVTHNSLGNEIRLVLRGAPITVPHQRSPFTVESHASSDLTMTAGR